MEDRCDAFDHYNHPVFRPREFLIPTPAMRQVREALTRCIYTRQTGMAITGEARAGKTCVARSIERNPIKHRNGSEVPILYASMPSRDQTTIRMVLRNLCISAGLKITLQDTADALSEMYFCHILDAFSGSKSPAVILLVDEFQHLAPKQFDAFAELYDRTERFNIDLTTVFIGSYPDCQGLLDNLEGESYTHVYGRFFRQHFIFRGLRSARDVRQCLSQYDKLVFPKNGPSYTCYFLPESNGDGWRLADMAEDIWAAFIEHTKGTGIKEWGMQYFISAINTLLCDILPSCGHLDYESQHLQECLNISGLVPGLTHARR